jgi:hypothetical protein
LQVSNLLFETLGIRFIRNDPTAQQIDLGAQLLQRGLQEFPEDCLLLFLAATYLAEFFGYSGAREADTLIEEVKKRKPSFDVKFLVYAKDRQEVDQRKTAGAQSTEQLQVLESAEYQNLSRQVHIQHLSALFAMREFWEAVRTHSSSAHLSTIVGKIAQSRKGASDSYNRLLEKFPNSKKVLRTYAQFLSCVDADNAKAAQLMTLVNDGPCNCFLFR